MTNGKPNDQPCPSLYTHADEDIANVSHSFIILWYPICASAGNIYLCFNRSALKKLWKISRTILLALIALIIMIWLAIQTSPVQNFLVRQVTRMLSKELHTTVRVGSVDFSLFNRMLLRETIVEDLHQDTLLFAGLVRVNISDWFFFRDRIELHYIGLQDAAIRLHRTDSVWNYRFLADYFSRPGGGGGNRSIALNIRELQLERVELVQEDRWRGEDMRASVGELIIRADEVDFNKKLIRISEIALNGPSFFVYNYPGNRPPRRQAMGQSPPERDSGTLRWNPAGWDLQVNRLTLAGGSFGADVKTDRDPLTWFDGKHILFRDIQLGCDTLRLQQDSITGNLRLSARERSGLLVQSLTARVHAHPEAMIFRELDLQTPGSRLQDYFAMEYDSFDDMGSFETLVRMHGSFRNAIVSSDDIAYFAPALREWNKKIIVNGTARGTVENLNGQQLVIQAGGDTYLKGNISLVGLPNIERTYIDFVAEDFRTTYADAIAFVPQLRQVRQPRLDLLRYLRFRGNFTGFLADFVTYGSIETNLGSLVTDLNMKFPAGRMPSYSGRLRTSGFSAGEFIGSGAVGRIVFAGALKGQGLQASTVDAGFDGTISLLEFRGYPYQGMTVNGTFTNEKFNGTFIAEDPNLQARLDGLIDFSQSLPQFHFNAQVSRADLRTLNLMKEQVDFSGKFQFNFEGNDFDNFFGTARIYEASVFHGGRRISFDSLSVESELIDSSKVITAVSNEFDAVLAGNFSFRDLPASVQTLLNRYYPSYIKRPSRPPGNENLSFVLTTKTVDEYIGLIHPELRGFNHATITGRIHSRENLLDLNAEIPHFSYGNISFHDLNLKARGGTERLSVEADMANVYLNDSLHFPGTRLRVSSSGDLSDLQIRTSANQALNAANIDLQVRTMANGWHFRFLDSQFDLNGKNWIIDKDGTLTLTRDFIEARGIRMHNGLQEIALSSVPSAIPGMNDLVIGMENLIMGDFTPYLVSSNRIEGLLTGKVQITDPLGKMLVDFRAEADQFRLDDDSVGAVSLRAKYYETLRELNFDAVSRNKDYQFDLQGIYRLKDSARSDHLDIFTSLRQTRIDLLQQYLTGVFSDITGTATGALRISGPAEDLRYTGSLVLADATLRVKYTNVLYSIPNANVELAEDRIDFGQFSFRDELGNTARITKGILYHRNFRDLSFDFAMTSPKLLVLSTNQSADEAYFGRVIAQTNMTLRGPLEEMLLDIQGAPADSSTLYINTSGGRQSGQADFIVWKVYGREMEPVGRSDASNLAINLDVTANNYADVYVILDELTGDIIQTNGRGNLKIMASTNGAFSITGRYDIDRGNYNFNFESLLRKPFKLRENVGNFIQWSGDPEKATIQIEAEYEAENVRFSDLGLSSQNFLAEVNANVTRYRGKVLVVASLTDQLQKPEIKFRIELPANSPLKNDVDALWVLNLIQNDENELNKQVAFLVVFNSFGPLSTSAQSSLAGTAFEGIVVGSISGVLSNTLSRQFSNVFQKIFNDKSIRVNFNAQLYSGTNFIHTLNRSAFNIDRTNLNLSVGKSLFNERLTFTFGSAVDFGLTPAQVNASRNLPFLPDITAEWKITPDGQLLLTFFYRDSYNYLTGAGIRQNRSGASISYRREFDTLEDLMRKRKKTGEGSEQTAEKF